METQPRNLPKTTAQMFGNSHDTHEDTNVANVNPTRMMEFEIVIILAP
jgi:hypothetical protein